MLEPQAGRGAEAAAPDGAVARLAWAEGLLQEAVYASRAAQAATTALGAAAPSATDRRCGLGHGPVALGEGPVALGETAAANAEPFADLDLSARSRELVRALWPVARSAPATAALRELLDGWIQAQDALDRKRNHFLRDFRAKHGRGRSEYAPEQASAFDRGLEQINEAVREQQLAHAARLLALPAAPDVR